MARKKDWSFFWEDPWEEMERMQERLNRMMSSLWRGTATQFMHQFPVDIIDADDSIIVRADLPGIDKKNISIRATEDTVEIHAEQSEEKREEGENFFRQERRFGSFHRTIPLPEEVDADSAEAKLEDGVLEIRLPKKVKSEKKKKEIKLK